jgi:membrane protein YqaA with SNARE-associated domain
LKGFALHLFSLFLHLGGPGLLILGILDSSFLFTPLGNDLLVIAMTARRPHMMWYYALMSTIGSTLGVLLVDVVCRKGGEEALEKYVPPKRLDYVKRKIQKSAGWALAVGSIAPPPFPFTVTVIAASALQYSRRRLLIIVTVFRMIRFAAEGVLAMMFGKRILHWADSPIVHGAVLGLVILCIVGSVWSVLGWIKKSKKVAQPA